MRIMTNIVLFLGVFAMASASAAERVLTKAVTVEAPVKEIWRAWTTADGLSFVSNKSRIELEPGGAYEWFLDLGPDADGRYGSETSHVLAVLPEQVLVFNWNFPPDVPALRASGAMTQVIVRFEAVSPERTRVHLDAVGWQEGDDWDRGYKYFDAAWSRVLTALQAAYDT